ncbi:MAG: leucine-rich repeat domain-containing protein [Clostridiales bacterium]|nr:leucine-rich repeat domain-containing protein [Clostridiales bacterium]
MEKAFRTKRLWLVIATIVIAVICAMCLVACGDDESSGDSGTHTVHKYENYVCTVCGEYAPDAPVTEGLSYVELEEYDEEKDERVVVGYAVVGIGESIDNDITEIFIPKSYNDKPVMCIGDYAFYNRSSLSNIVIPNSVTRIYPVAFYNTAYYNNESNWKDDVLYIGNYLIQAKDTLSGSYAIKQGTRVIADSAFMDCSSSLTSITIPNSVTSIGRDAFYGCRGLTSVTIPNSVISIGINSFRFCGSLTSVIIDKGVTIIDSGAFYGCVSLTSVTIPNSVTLISMEAFAYCTNLKNIKYNGTMEQWEAIAEDGWDVDMVHWNTGANRTKYIETIECTDGTITLSND